MTKERFNIEVHKKKLEREVKLDDGETVIVRQSNPLAILTILKEKKISLTKMDEKELGMAIIENISEFTAELAALIVDPKVVVSKPKKGEMTLSDFSIEQLKDIATEVFGLKYFRELAK